MSSFLVAARCGGWCSRIRDDRRGRPRGLISRGGLQTVRGIERLITIAIKLPVDVERRLRAVAERTGRSQSAHAQEALLHYLEDLEDELIALERLDQPERRWTLDDLEHELDMER
jgi:RHH-type rel operon transcriptional repressor/antitoxin RelB